MALELKKDALKVIKGRFTEDKVYKPSGEELAGFEKGFLIRKRK